MRKCDMPYPVDRQSFLSCSRDLSYIDGVTRCPPKLAPVYPEHQPVVHQAVSEGQCVVGAKVAGMPTFAR